MPAERTALERRYKAALQQAESRGTRPAVEAFEAATRGTKAVMARPLRELDRLASSDKELFPTYYSLIQGEVRLPHGNEWDLLRALADTALFPGDKKENVRFAALSLDGSSLPHYGECSFVFKESMIAHRTSVYEENSAVFLKKHAYTPPPGYRATWEERVKLAVAKLGGGIDAITSPSQLADALLGPGATPEEDRFIEVHIWGPMSIRTVERVSVTAPIKGPRSVRKAIRDRLKAVGLSLEELA